MLGGHHLAVGSCRAPSVASDRVMSADRWPAIAAGLRPEVVNSALGTTIAKAGSRQAIAALIMIPMSWSRQPPKPRARASF